MKETNPQTGKGLIAAKVAALAAVGMLGGLALANRISDLGVGEPPVILNGQQGIYTWKRGEIAYTVKGHKEPLVLVHGIYAGASSYEFQRVFDTLAHDFRVYSLDLLGF